ncbi:MAG: DUF2927 domain-containing protein [Alphaproteobacteria bacterium GM202ARS2]|nr:DUF2927 domain-containing protein [Alphaproteobacteria bacterium GM202ARS2]
MADVDEVRRAFDELRRELGLPKRRRFSCYHWCLVFAGIVGSCYIMLPFFVTNPPKFSALFDYVIGREFEPPLLIPKDIPADECHLDFACSLAVFTQMAVTGSKPEPLLRWGIVKWDDRTVTVGLHGVEHLSAKARPSVWAILDYLLDLHNRYGRAVRMAMAGERPDVMVVFTHDYASGQLRFDDDPELVPFASLFARARPKGPFCFEISALPWFGSKAKTSSLVMIKTDEIPSDPNRIRVLRCLMEELTHALSPLQRDLPVHAASFFLDDANKVAEEWIIEFSPLDHHMLAIGHHPMIKHGDSVHDIAAKFPAIHQEVLTKLSAGAPK